MKFLKFVFYFLKNGSFKGEPLDFEQRRKEILESAPMQPKSIQKSRYILLRNKLAKGRYTGAFVAALAFVKNIKTIHKQYFIVDSLQLSYVRIFKAGSTSVLRQLLPAIDSELQIDNFNDKQIDELSNQYASTQFDAHQEHYQRFTIVRNPFHRMVSVYLDLFGANNSFFSYQSYFFGIIKKDMNFSQFVQVVYQIPDAMKSMHFISQYHIVKLSGGKEKVRCFCMERELLDLKMFLNNYNLKLEHINKHTLDYDYRVYYNMHTFQLVYAMYRTDVEQFDYWKEYEALADYLKNTPR